MLGTEYHSAVIQVSSDSGLDHGGSRAGSDESRMVNELRWGREIFLLGFFVVFVFNKYYLF